MDLLVEGAFYVLKTRTCAGDAGSTLPLHALQTCNSVLHPLRAAAPPLTPPIPLGSRLPPPSSASMGACELKEASPEVVTSLEAKLKDPSSTLAQKYRVMFSLRNLAGEAAHRALETGA